MKKLFLVGAIMISVSLSIKVNSQQIITVQNGSAVSFYNNLDSVILEASNGDTVYLPGGPFIVTKPISKRLYIFGVGHNPDSTAGISPTYITSTLYLITGADGGQLSGVYLQGGISFGISQTNGDVKNYSVNRCNVASIYFNSNLPSNNIFYENIIRGALTLGIVNSNSVSNGFYNNIIESGLYHVGPNNLFKNNIFLSVNFSLTGANVQGSMLENNIFIGIYILNPFSNSIFNNNLFVESTTFPYGSNIGSNNIVSQTQSSIFVNQTGNSFSYSQNYHLKASSPGKNAGVDGKDIGIYGGLFPWKEGSLPNNPHIQFKNISGTTDQNGNLQINIKVKAQDN